MKLNGKTESSIRKGLKIRNGIGFIVISLLFVIIGTIAIVIPDNDIVTTAEITRIVHDNQNDTDYVLVNFTDANGKEHENVTFNSYTSGWKKGKEIKISYDPNDPETLSSATPRWIFGTVAVIIGAVVFAFSLISTKKAISKNTDDMDEYNQVDYSQNTAQTFEFSNEPLTRYYFHFGGKMNQSYIVEDKDHNIVYDIKMTKFTLIKPYEFEFINHLTGYRKTYNVTHTVSFGTGAEKGNLSYSYVTESYCKIDGTKCWDYIASKGYGFDVFLEKLRLRFKVKKHGAEVANIEGAGLKSLFNDEENPKGDLLHTRGIYRVDCRPSDLDDVMMVTFCIARAARVYGE